MAMKWLDDVDRRHVECSGVAGDSFGWTLKRELTNTDLALNDFGISTPMAVYPSVLA